MSVPHPHERRLPAAAVLGVVIALLAMLALAPAASAEGVGEKIILRCTHSESLAGFSQRDYQQALEELSGDALEYSPCAQEIRQAARAAAGAPKGGPSSAETAAPVALAATPGELRSLDRAKHRGFGAVRVGGQVIHPGVVHASIASAFSTLPAPLLAVLALMVACALTFIAIRVRKRVGGRRGN